MLNQTNTVDERINKQFAASESFGHQPIFMCAYENLVYQPNYCVEMIVEEFAPYKHGKARLITTDPSYNVYVITTAYCLIRAIKWVKPLSVLYRTCTLHVHSCTFNEWTLMRYEVRVCWTWYRGIWSMVHHVRGNLKVWSQLKYAWSPEYDFQDTSTHSMFRERLLQTRTHEFNPFMRHKWYMKGLTSWSKKGLNFMSWKFLEGRLLL